MYLRIMKILKSTMLTVGMLMALLVVTSCTEWGESDPVAGNMVFPDRQVVTTFTFQYEDVLSQLLDMDYTNDLAEVTSDDFLGSDVLHVDGSGYVRIKNPLNDVKLQNGAAITFWVKTSDESLDRALLTFAEDLESEDATRFYFTRNAQLVYTKRGQLQSLELNENDPEMYKTGVITTDTWHFVALQFSKNGYQLFVDGYKSVSATVENPSATSFSYETLLKFLNTAPYIYIGKGSAENAEDISIDDLRLIRNQMTAKDWARPTIQGGGISIPSPVYFNDFTSKEGLTIVGSGYFRHDDAAGFGQVFQNAASSAPRQNYLVLPEDVLSHSAETQQMTISVWVNASRAGESASYMWAPLFTAYGAKNDPNSWPMLACQYRGVLQVNCSGWSDYTDAQNVAGANTLYHNETDWLADKQWHLYTVVFDGENAKVYFDGEIANEWNLDGITNTQLGLFNNGSELKYVCLGGNQAWNWGDNDAGFAFDDIAIYDVALTPSQIKEIMAKKASGGGTEPVWVTLGNEACSDGWWTVFSEPVQLKNGQTAHFGFENYTSGLEFFHNWALVCTNNGGMSTGAASEYFVLRADKWAWGSGFDSPGNIEGDMDFGTFKADMQGAWVDVTVKRTGSTIVVTAVTTTKEEKTFSEKFTYEGATAETCGLYFTLEKAYLRFDMSKCYVED